MSDDLDTWIARIWPLCDEQDDERTRDKTAGRVLSYRAHKIGRRQFRERLLRAGWRADMTFRDALDALYEYQEHCAPSDGRKHRECYLCRLSYVACLPGDRQIHRRQCGEHKRALWPVASAGVARLRGADGLVRITPLSPRWLVARLHRWMRLMCRECGYDFAPYVHDSDWSIVGWLLADEDGTVRAVAATRHEGGWRGRAQQDGVALCWVWVPVLHRRRGALSQMWEKITARHELAQVEGPFSPNMWEFLDKIGYSRRQRSPCEVGRELYLSEREAAAWRKEGPRGVWR